MFPLSAASPKCVALRSKHDNSYLRTVHDESPGRGNLVELSGGGADDATDGGGVMNPRSRFYLEPSKEHDGLMHVRCCYNNKYWVPQQRVLDGSARWIVGTADEPEEDLSKSSCTLFKPVPIAGEDDDDDRSTIRLLHSQLGKCAGLLSTSGTSIRRYLHIAHEEDGRGNNLVDAYTVIDVSRQKQLPSYVAFQDANGYFLGGMYHGGNNYLQFSIKDIGNKKVVQNVLTDGSFVRIKSMYHGYYWRRSPNWIWADNSFVNTLVNPDSLFKVTTGDDFIALQNQGNKNFCIGLTKDGKSDCLNAAVSSITNAARMKCYEPVLSRRIYDVDFRLDEARIQTTKVEGLDSQIVMNGSPTKTQVSEVVFTYTNTVSTTWSSTVSMKIGITTEFQAGIPFVADGKIEVSAEFSGTYEWGETKTEEKQASHKLTVEVPPMKKVTVLAIGSNGVCDIPFSYKQTDVLFTGEEVTQKFTDGLYLGVKTSSVSFKTIEEELQ